MFAPEPEPSAMSSYFASSPEPQTSTMGSLFASPEPEPSAMGSLFSPGSSSPSAPPAAAAGAKSESSWGGLFGGTAPEPEPEPASLSSLLSSPTNDPPPPENGGGSQGWGLFGKAPEPEPQPSGLSALLASPKKEEPPPTTSDQERPGFVGSLFGGAAAAPEPENDPPPASGGWGGLFASPDTAPAPSDEPTSTPSDEQALRGVGDGSNQDTCFLLCSSSASEEQEHVAQMRRYYRIWSDAVASHDSSKMDELLPLLADDVEFEWVTMASTASQPPASSSRWGFASSDPSLGLFASTRTKEDFVARLKAVSLDEWQVTQQDLRLMTDVKAMGCCMLFTNSMDGMSVGRTGKSIDFQTPHLTTNNLIFGEDGKIRSWKVYNRGSAEELAKIRELFVLSPMKI